MLRVFSKGPPEKTEAFKAPGTVSNIVCASDAKDSFRLILSACKDAFDRRTPGLMRDVNSFARGKGAYFCPSLVNLATDQNSITNDSQNIGVGDLSQIKLELVDKPLASTVIDWLDGQETRVDFHYLEAEREDSFFSDKLEPLIAALNERADKLVVTLAISIDEAFKTENSTALRKFAMEMASLPSAPSLATLLYGAEMALLRDDRGLLRTPHSLNCDVFNEFAEAPGKIAQFLQGHPSVAYSLYDVANIDANIPLSVGSISAFARSGHSLFAPGVTGSGLGEPSFFIRHNMVTNVSEFANDRNEAFGLNILTAPLSAAVESYLPQSNAVADIVDILNLCPAQRVREAVYQHG